MALLFVAVVIVAHRNPELVQRLRRRASLTNGTAKKGSMPALLGSGNRSDAEEMGTLEASVVSILQLDGRSMHSVDRKAVEDSEPVWEVDGGEQEEAVEALPAAANGGRVVARGERLPSDRVMHLTVFEDQPETLQMYLHVYKRRGALRERHLAVARIPIGRAIGRSFDLVSATLNLVDEDEPVGVLQVALKYLAKGQSGESFDHYSALPSVPSASLAKSRKGASHKKKWGLGLWKDRSKSPRIGSDEGFSVYV